MKKDRARQLIVERSEAGGGLLSKWSKAIGKNHAYLQQFIERGSPAKLPEDVRSKLAEVMDVPEHALMASPKALSVDGTPSGIREIDVRAGLGGGGTVDQNLAWRDGEFTDPVKEEPWRFPARFLREEVRAPADRVIILETEGDSMSPTILSGDRVIVDTGHRLPSPDGIYAIRDRYGSIVVKRLQVLRRGDPPKIRIISDNKSHDAEDVGADEIAIVGRVLWGLKRL